MSQLTKEKAVNHLKQRAEKMDYAPLVSSYLEAALCLEKAPGESLDDIFRKAQDDEQSWSRVAPWASGAFLVAALAVFALLLWAAGATAGEGVWFFLATPFLGAVAANSAAALCHDRMARSHAIQRACGTAWGVLGYTWGC